MTMKKIIILGYSIAGLSAAEELRQKEGNCEIRLFPTDGTNFYFPHLLAGLLTKEVKESAAISCKAERLAELEIVLAPGKISRINLNRGRITADDTPGMPGVSEAVSARGLIPRPGRAPKGRPLTTEENETFDYDYLIIADAGLLSRADIKGDNKTGFYLWPRSSAIEPASKALALSDTVVVQGDGYSALNLALTIGRAGKEVILVSGPEDFLAGLVDKETSAILRPMVEESGVRLLTGNSVVEILGDTDVKAIRLKSGKVIGAQMVFWTDVKQDLRLFKETDLVYQDKVSVDAEGRTNFANVLAVVPASAEPGRPIEIESERLLCAMTANGRLAAQALLGVAAEPESFSVSEVDFTIKDKKVRLIGQTIQNATTTMVTKTNNEAQMKIKIFAQAERMVGAVLINAEAWADSLRRLITDRADLAVAQGVLGSIVGEANGITGDPDIVSDSPKIVIPA